MPVIFFVLCVIYPFAGHTSRRCSRGPAAAHHGCVCHSECRGKDYRIHKNDSGIVIQGVEMLHELTSVAFACAMLLDLTYVLKLASAKPFCFTFELLHKIITQLEQHKISLTVQILYGRLQSSLLQHTTKYGCPEPNNFCGLKNLSGSMRF